MHNVVTLRGTVGTLAATNAAERIAKDGNGPSTAKFSGPVRHRKQEEEPCAHVESSCHTPCLADRAQELREWEFLYRPHPF